MGPADTWGESSLQLRPAPAAAEGLARDLEVERRQEAQREAAVREARKKI